MTHRHYRRAFSQIVRRSAAAHYGPRVFAEAESERQRIAETAVVTRPASNRDEVLRGTEYEVGR